MFFFGLIVVGAFPLFAASVFAKRSFARRCCGVCAWYMLIIIHRRITFAPTMIGCGEIFEEDGWGREMIQDVNVPAKKGHVVF